MPEPDLKRVDFEPYFMRWNSVIHYPKPGVPQVIHGYSGNASVIPCHQHVTCMRLVLAQTKYPPRICPHCGADTKAEIDIIREKEVELGSG
jgi:hypothetical protein